MRMRKRLERRARMNGAQRQAVDFSGVSWGDLRAAAKEVGINTFGLSRAQVEAALDGR